MLKKFNKTILIAEACENHFGNIKYAKEMVVKSKKSGADFVKFQHHIPEEEMLKNVPNQVTLKFLYTIFLKKIL